MDTKPDPYHLKLVKTVEPEDIFARTGYSRLHTVHCGPDAIYLNGIGSADGGSPGGILRIDHNTFEPLGRWELDRGPQLLSYDFWWHIGLDVVVTSEWGTSGYVRKRPGPGTHREPQLRAQSPLLGPSPAAVTSRKSTWAPNTRWRWSFARPTTRPRAYGFVGVVVNANDLSGAVFTWYQENGKWAATKIIDIPAEPADPELLPEAFEALGSRPAR